MHVENVHETVWSISSSGPTKLVNHRYLKRLVPMVTQECLYARLGIREPKNICF